MELKISLILVACAMFCVCEAWDNDELEIFDLVEEINANFYTVLGLEQTAETSEVRQAYRRLSLVLHPDKNDAEDAEVKFRQLVSIYDTLRDPKKRMLYNNVLLNGLPDWKQAVYYYRRARKVGLAEMSLILFGIITVGQYIVAWAAYAERKYTFEQLMDLHLKKQKKKQKKGKYDGPPLPEVIDINLPKPSVINTLPCQIPLLCWYLLRNAPHSVRLLRDYLEERRRAKEEERLLEEEEEEEPIELEPRQPRRRRPKPTLPEQDPASVSTPVAHTAHTDIPPTPTLSGGLWTDDDFQELIRLVKKHPPGTVTRWEVIASTMCRTVSEVTHMAKKVKDEGYRPAKPEGEELEVEVEEVKKVKTKGGKLVVGAEQEEWSQPQQRALEAALIKFPKAGTLERWEKIAKSVPGKTKEECIVRYKQLVEVVKRKKESEELSHE